MRRPNSVWHVGRLGSRFGVTWYKNYPGYSSAQLQSLRGSRRKQDGDAGCRLADRASAGKLLLNVYMAQFKRGWSYTFIYQMVDNQGGDSAGWGFSIQIIRRRLAATYIHNLTTILADNSSFTPGALNYSIPSEPATCMTYSYRRVTALSIWLCGREVDGYHGPCYRQSWRNPCFGDCL